MILAIKSSEVFNAQSLFEPTDIKPGNSAENVARAEMLNAMGSGTEERSTAVAVMPLFGVLSQHQTDSWLYSTTSTDLFGRAFDRVIESSNYSAVVINAHSPGGQVWGTAELGKKIFEARGKKPIIFVSNSMSASACYWIGAQADEFVITPGGECGAIGVYSVRYDDSKALEDMGVEKKVYSMPTKKAEVAGVIPASPETDEEIMGETKEYYDRFISAVAKGRGKSVSHVREEFGGGGVKLAKQALEAGMADRIATLDQVVSKLIKRRGKSSAANRRRVQLESI